MLTLRPSQDHSDLSKLGELTLFIQHHALFSNTANVYLRLAERKCLACLSRT